MKASVTALLLAATIFPALLVKTAGLPPRPLMPALLHVGGLSYALYIVQYPLAQALNQVALFRPIVNVAIVAVLSFALSYLLDYRFQS